MNSPILKRHSLAAALLGAAFVQCAFTADRVKISNGVLESTTAAVNGVRSFKGIPFAQPPVGDLRWREPQPVQNWKGVRKADDFGPKCMQRINSGGDYWFRSKSMSEDCLYLNVWTPAKSGKEKLPVLVYIYGGGFSNGDGSEPRYDGGNMAAKGMVAVTINYRLNVFGFLSHPELTKESPHHASGNYGLMDQAAALAWVQKNIAAFGGDPKRVTIAGESAGSISVSALTASPSSRGLIAGAIAESGGLIGNSPPQPLAQTEQAGAAFANSVGAPTLAALRALPADQLMDLMSKARGARFWPNLDGYFLPKTLVEIFEAGEQAKIPFLGGTNSEEQGARSVLQNAEPTPENLASAIKRLYPNGSDAIVKAFPAKTQDEALDAAARLASIRWIGYGTWKWIELQAKTGGKPVYWYYYTRVRPPFLGNAATPAPTPAPGRGAPAPARGAAHSAEIQYCMGNLDLDQRYPWTPEDHKVSQTMQGFFVNFIKTGNPNGAGLPNWPAYNQANPQRMRIDVNSHAEPEVRDQYLAVEAAQR